MLLRDKDTLFPTDFAYSNNKASNNEIPMLYDYLIDLRNGSLILNENGQAIIIQGLDALVTQVWRVLHTPKNEFLSYTNEYGNKLYQLIGKGKSVADFFAYDYLTECLLKDEHLKKYINDIDDFKTSFVKGKYIIEFKLKTIYGDKLYKIQDYNVSID